MRLIDAEELTELVHWDYGKPPFSRKKVLNMIDMARTIDAVPVRYGKWIHRGCGVFTCDKCSRDIGLNVYTTEKASERFKYCPNCGARMDAERKEDEI